jgi:hypothetical protein
MYVCTCSKKSNIITSHFQLYLTNSSYRISNLRKVQNQYYHFRQRDQGVQTNSTLAVILTSSVIKCAATK